MGLNFDAIYENGVLRPLSPLPLAEHARVSVTVQEGAPVIPALNGCAGTLTAEAAAEMCAIVEREFERVDPRDW